MGAIPAERSYVEIGLQARMRKTLCRMLFSFWEVLLTERRDNTAVASRWLTVEQIRKQQRMRRESVVAAMLAGHLPFEQRGRIRYARVSDVEAWERSRIARLAEPATVLVHPALVGLSHA